MSYVLKFRRHNKERFWESTEMSSLYGIYTLLESLFEKTKEESLEIVIIHIRKVNKK